MVKRLHQAISMTHNQKLRLALLAEKLGMTKSEVVNHLVYACMSIQVLQDLIKSNSDFPAKCKLFAHNSAVNIVHDEIQLTIDELYRKINNRIECLRLNEKARENMIHRRIDQEIEMEERDKYGAMYQKFKEENQ